MLVTTPDFPVDRADITQVAAELSRAGVMLRRAKAADILFLRQLYSETRAAELAVFGWSETARTQFLNSQFDLQHRHYVNHYADADFLMLEQDKKVIGRLYLQRTAPDFLIVDISLLQRAQGTGIGSRLIVAVQKLAAAADCGVQLHVDRRNLGAQRLYRRLGFVLVDHETAQAYLRMQWRANALAPLTH
ncbi:MAG: GNAT family N-acetyltransferase [Rhodanobacter sp.]